MSEPTPQPEAQGTPRTDAEAFTKCTTCNGTGWAGRDGSDMGSCPKCRGVAWLKEVQGYSVPASFARQLETELAAERAARQKAERERDEFDKEVDGQVEINRRNSELIRLLAEERARIVEKMEAVARGRDLELKARVEMTKERDALQAKLATAESERNTWRSACLLYHSELRDLAEGKKVETQLGFHVEQRIKGLQAKLAEVERQRDEAIELAKEGMEILNACRAAMEAAQKP